MEEIDELEVAFTKVGAVLAVMAPDDYGQIMTWSLYSVMGFTVGAMVMNGYERAEVLGKEYAEILNEAYTTTILPGPYQLPASMQQYIETNLLEFFQYDRQTLASMS